MEFLERIPENGTFAKECALNGLVDQELQAFLF